MIILQITDDGWAQAGAGPARPARKTATNLSFVALAEEEAARRLGEAK